MSIERRQSGTDWLGEIPTHWGLVPLGAVFHERKTVVSDSDYQPLSVSMSGIVPRMDGVALTDNNDARKLALAGDYVINSRSDRKGSGGISPLDGSVSVISTVLRPVGIEPRYAHHLLRSTAFQEEFYRWGSGIVADLWSTRFSAMRRIMLPLPPPTEQLAIADFLDAEEAQIGLLVGAQTDLIELLTARSGSLLNHLTWPAEGRAELPYGWAMVSLTKAVKSIVDYRGATPVKVEDGVQLVTARNVKQGFIDYECSKEYVSESTYASTMRRGLPATGDLLMTMEAPLGNFALVDRVDIALAQRVIKLRAADSVLPDFLLLAALAPRFQAQLASLATGSTALGIKASKLHMLRLPIPPVAEQRRIVRAASVERRSSSEAIASAEQFITLTRERHAALVVAAVTGQIDPCTRSDITPNQQEQ